MNPSLVVGGVSLARSGKLRLAPGAKESDAIVELFLAGGRSSRDETPPTFVVPEGITAPPRRARPAPATRPRAGANAATACDALDLLIEEPGVSDRDAAAAATARDVQTQPVPNNGIADRPAVLAACLDGLRRIDARCPYAPDIELAVDGDGALHLIAWRGPGDAGGAVGGLLIASKWAWEHLSLLTKLAPLNERVRPAVQHVITAERGGLRSLLTTSLRVHLAILISDGVRGGVGDGTGRRWVCAALSEG